MMKKIIALASLAACPLFAQVNLIRNADFSEGLKHFGFSDAMPEKVGAKIGEDPQVGKYLTYRSDAVGLGGLNFSEVYVGSKGRYKFSFKAKASKNLTIRLAAYTHGRSIYRSYKADFDLDGSWRDFSCVIDAAKRPKGDVWLPLRIEKNAKGKDREAADFFFADFKLEPLDAAARANAKKNDSLIYTDISLSAADGKPKLIFGKNDDISVSVRWGGVPAGGAKAKASLRVFELPERGDVFKKEFQADISAGGAETKINIGKLGKNGVYRAELAIGGAFAAAGAFAVSPQCRAKRGELPIDVGYCGVITNGESAAPTEGEVEFLANSGISFLRMWDNGNPFNWRCIEPEEGKYFWDITDETVRLAKKNDIDVMVVLGGMFFIYPPQMGIRGHRQAPWLYAKSPLGKTTRGFEKQGRKAILPPMEDWTRMVKTVATRYKGVINTYEVINEPNIIWEDPRTYCPYLEAAYKTLKEVSPENIVIAYGGQPPDFLETILQNGAGKNCDVIAYHAYRSLFEDSANPAAERHEYYRGLSKKYGGNHGVYITELYYLNPHSKGGGDHKGGTFHPGYLARRYLVDASSGIPVDTLIPANTVGVGVYQTGVHVENFSKGEDVPYGSGGKRIGIVPTQRYIVAAAFAKNLKGTKFSKSVELGDKMLAHVFSDAKTGRAVAAVFALGATMENVSGKRELLRTRLDDPLDRAPKNLGKLPSSVVSVEDVFGNDVAPNAAGETVLTVSPMPVYITAKNMDGIDAVLAKLAPAKK